MTAPMFYLTLTLNTARSDLTVRSTKLVRGIVEIITFTDILTISEYIHARNLVLYLQISKTDDFGVQGKK